MSDIKKKIRELIGDALQVKEGKDEGKEFSISVGKNASNITVISKSKINIAPGMEHITDEQAVYIKELAHEVARLERLYAQNRVTVPMVWAKLKARLKVTSYRLIPKEQYSEAVGLLIDWQQQALEDSRRTPESLLERSDIYHQCHAIAKQYGLATEMRAFMERKWDAESMRDLEDYELKELLSFMRALESQYKKSKK